MGTINHVLERLLHKDKDKKQVGRSKIRQVTKRESFFLLFMATLIAEMPTTKRLDLLIKNALSLHLLPILAVVIVNGNNDGGVRLLNTKKKLQA